MFKIVNENKPLYEKLSQIKTKRKAAILTSNDESEIQVRVGYDDKKSNFTLMIDLQSDAEVIDILELLSAHLPKYRYLQKLSALESFVKDYDSGKRRDPETRNKAIEYLDLQKDWINRAFKPLEKLKQELGK